MYRGFRVVTTNSASIIPKAITENSGIFGSIIAITSPGLNPSFNKVVANFLLNDLSSLYFNSRPVEPHT